MYELLSVVPVFAAIWAVFVHCQGDDEIIHIFNEQGKEI